MYIKIYFKELAHTIVEAGQVKNLLEWSSRLETQGGAKSKAVCWKIPSFLEEASLCSSRAFSWLDVVLEGNLLYSGSTDLTVNLIQKNTISEIP